MLEENYAQSMSEQLNELLADIQVFYTNVRGYHWNIKGKMFFLLHEKFEGLYDDLAEKADEVAERILMLDHTPVNAFSEYLKISSIKESVGRSDAETTVKEVIEGLQTLITKERKLIEEAGKNGDEGTVDLLTGYISGQEKMIWMYAALLG